MITVSGLTAAAGGHRILHPVDLTLAAGETLVVLGESGSGKSTLGLALLGEAGPGVRLGGSVVGAGVGHLPQHPGTALDPVRRIGAVLRELAGIRHRDTRPVVAAACAAARLDPALLRRFPHQLSGGQQQRAALAQVLATEPVVLVLDEPTTGLDPGTAAELVDRLLELRAAGTALVLLTHDHTVARRLGGRAIELADGRVVRRGDIAELVPEQRAGPSAVAAAERPPRLVARGLRVADRAGRAVLRGVDLEVAAGELIAVVGRSGAGKTTLGRVLAGLVPAAGTVAVDGAVLPRRRRRADRRRVQYVHQDARATFRPHRPVLEQVARPAVLLRGASRAEAREAAAALLGRLGLDPATAERRPGTLSGGQLQRAAVARALVARPEVLVADEVTSALDARHRARVLAALDGLRRTHATAVLLISHDLPLVEQVADRVLVVEDGRVLPGVG
jgi:peptide/nickel transport system ATP-binding protein